MRFVDLKYMADRFGRNGYMWARRLSRVIKLLGYLCCLNLSLLLWVVFRPG